jgi:transmembrane sensor
MDQQTRLDQQTRQLEALHAQQASAWLEALRHPGPGDEARFIAWLKESPRNVRDFLLMLTVDQALEQLDAQRLRDIESLLSQVDRRVVPLSMRSTAVAVAGGLRRWSLAALAACVVAGGAWAWLLHHSSSWQEFETATGEQRAFELDDGSVVYLNTHSHVKIRFAPQVREVRLLQGEALFRVHHDANRPFRVYTDDAMVQAVGTQFDVYRRDDGTVVAVLEGRVNVTPQPPPAAQALSADQSIGNASAAVRKTVLSRSLIASEEAEVSHAGLVTVREMNDVADSVAWRERRLIFHEQTLQRIVDEFNRYRRTPIRLEGDELPERIYTGVFDADDSDSLAQVLARDPALAVERSGDRIVVRLRSAATP